MYVYIITYTHTLYMYMDMDVNVYVCVCINIYIYVHIYMYVCMYVRVYTAYCKQFREGSFQSSRFEQVEAELEKGLALEAPVAKIKAAQKAWSVLEFGSLGLRVWQFGFSGPADQRLLRNSFFSQLALKAPDQQASFYSAAEMFRATGASGGNSIPFSSHCTLPQKPRAFKSECYFKPLKIWSLVAELHVRKSFGRRTPQLRGTAQRIPHT